MKSYNEFKKIKNRIPYSTLGIEYSNFSTIIKKAGDFEAILNKKIVEFEKQGINISTCFNYFEDMIDGYIEKLLNILESEHLKYENTVGYFFRKRASDRTEFQELLNNLEAEIVSTKEEYNTVKEIYEKFNPLKNGQLTIKGLNDPFLEEEKDG